jgi:hypothetical protein
MENKNNMIMFSIAFLVLGFIAGWVIKPNTQQQVATGMHQMPNGQMMSGEGMDMGAMMKGMMAGLDGKTGDAFDKAFIDEMIMHHEGAVDMAEAALQDAKHQEIKDMGESNYLCTDQGNCTDERMANNVVRKLKHSRSKLLSHFRH